MHNQFSLSHCILSCGEASVWLSFFGNKLLSVTRQTSPIAYRSTRSLYMESRVSAHTHTRRNPHSITSRYCVFKVATCCFHSSWSPVPVRGLGYCCLMSRGSPQTCSESRLLLLLCVSYCSADQRRHAGLCPRANCCYLADSLSVLYSHWLPGLQGDSHRHPKTNKPGRTIDKGCKSYRSTQPLIKIPWKCVCMCAVCKSVSLWRCLLFVPTP